VLLFFDQFYNAFELARHKWKNAGNILKTILYECYASGTCVDEPHAAKGDRSDLDLLTISATSASPTG
jgi:hypothetical protein